MAPNPEQVFQHSHEFAERGIRDGRKLQSMLLLAMVHTGVARVADGVMRTIRRTRNPRTAHHRVARS